MEIKQTSEAKLRKAFVDAVLNLSKSKEEGDHIFHLSVVAAAGSLVCHMLKELGMPKETMENIMEALWSVGKGEDKN